MDTAIITHKNIQTKFFIIFFIKNFLLDTVFTLILYLILICSFAFLFVPSVEIAVIITVFPFPAFFSIILLNL